MVQRSIVAVTLYSVVGCGGNVVGGSHGEAADVADAGAGPVTNAPFGTQASDAGVVVCPLPGDAGAEVTVLASCLEWPSTILVAGSNVYWGSVDGIKRVPTGGGEPVLLTSGGDPGGLVIDAQNLYWTERITTVGAVIATPLSGGPDVVSAQNQDAPTDIVVVGPTVYWSDRAGGSVMAMPTAADSPPRMLWSADATFAGGPDGLSTDGVNLYWTAATDAGVIVKAPIDGGRAVILASGQKLPAFTTTDGTNVYWTDPLATTVMKVAVDGGTPIALATGQDRPNGIAVDDGNVYWANSGGSIMKVPVGGGTPVSIASDQHEPARVAVDATSVYWTNTGRTTRDGSVCKAPK